MLMVHTLAELDIAVVADGECSCMETHSYSRAAGIEAGVANAEGIAAVADSIAVGSLLAETG